MQDTVLREIIFLPAFVCDIMTSGKAFRSPKRRLSSIEKKAVTALRGTNASGGAPWRLAHMLQKNGVKLNKDDADYIAHEASSIKMEALKQLEVLALKVISRAERRRLDEAEEQRKKDEERARARRLELVRIKEMEKQRQEEAYRKEQAAARTSMKKKIAERPVATQRYIGWGGRCGPSRVRPMPSL